MRIAFFVNSIEGEHPRYTTTALALAALTRGHDICYLTPGDFVLRPDDSLQVRARTLPGTAYKKVETFHQREALHAQREAGRGQHRVDEEAERAEGEHRPRQAVEAVDEDVEPARGRGGELGAELVHRGENLVARGGVALGAVADEDLGDAADRLADLARGAAGAEDAADQAHAATRAWCSASDRRKRSEMNSSARVIQPPLPPSLRRAYLRLAGRWSARR